MTSMRIGAAALALSMLIGGPAAALSTGLLGQTITVENLTSGGSNTFTVLDPGVELDSTTGIGNFDLYPGEAVDVLDLGIVLTMTAGLDVDLRFSGYSGVVTGVSGVSATSGDYFNDGLTEIAGDGSWFVIKPVFDAIGGRVEYALTFAADNNGGGGAGVVPLPAPALMLLTGLAGLGLARRRRKG